MPDRGQYRASDLSKGSKVYFVPVSIAAAIVGEPWTVGGIATRVWFLMETGCRSKRSTEFYRLLGQELGVNRESQERAGRRRRRENAAGGRGR